MSAEKQDIFTMDKRNADEILIESFWHHLKKKIEGPNAFLEKVIFPNSAKENSSFFGGRELSIGTFKNCHFHNIAFFSTKFQQNITFENCIFEGDVSFENSRFFGQVLFSRCYFGNNINFKSIKAHADFEILNSSFKSYVDFSLSTFENQCNIESSLFFGELNLSKSQFKGLSEFQKNIIKGKFTLNNARIGGGLLIADCDGNKLHGVKLINSNGDISLESNYFSEIHFIHISFHGLVTFKKNTFEKINLSSNTYLNDLLFDSESYGSANFDRSEFGKSSISKFYNISSSNFVKKPRAAKISFRKINSFEGVVFVDTSLRNAVFQGSIFLDGDFNSTFTENKRLIIGDEQNSGETISFSEISNIYRKFKLCFEQNKNWDLAAKAFRSEMIMKRKSLFENITSISNFIQAIFEFIFHLVYGGLSGYNQSAVRPLLILLGTIGFGAFYYSHFELNPTNDGLQMSFGASFPYLIKIAEDLTYDVWWIKLIQTFLSSILIAFFIIALRKKFKQ